MKPLPKQFLANIATEYDLSKEQTETFIQRFSSKNKSEQLVAEELHISHGAFRTRMTGVYNKFGIEGTGPGKSRKLYNWLLSQYKKSDLLINEDKDIERLVQDVRDKISRDIKQRCGTMRVLDMTQAIALGEIYTNVNILEKITSNRRFELAQLQQNSNQDKENFNRWGLSSRISEERVPGLEVVGRYQKLMVWGKPGSGKTTFLKYLAIECIERKFQEQRVPIFITLKDFAQTDNQPTLLTFIQQLLLHYEVQETEITSLLKQGKAFILLDGLDEVRQKDSARVIDQIQYLANFYPKNCFVITCRIAAKEYTFQGFTEVEVADFDEQQIETFALKWFSLQDEVKGKLFIEKLEEQENQPIRELATNPLLLTLLCLVFGESLSFPHNRSELYKEGIDILLKKWDGKRNIERDIVYQKLSLKRKEDLLSQIAWTTFKAGDYFFKQRQVERYIGDYIYNLPDAKTDPEALQLDSEAILKSMESQHGLLLERAKGIYSFSHLTFQEYFTARKIVTTFQEKDLPSLVSYLTEIRWREVFFLTLEMLPNADGLLKLMKKKVDEIIAPDDKLQQFLNWLMQKDYSLFKIANSNYESKSLDNLSYERLSDYLYYCWITVFIGYNGPDLPNLIQKNIDLDNFVNSTFVLDKIQSKSKYSDCLLVYHYGMLRFLSLVEFDKDPERHLNELMSICLDSNLDDTKKQYFKELQTQLPKKNLEQWWKTNSETWMEQLRSGIIEHFHIRHDWKFNNQQIELLWHYYHANRLLLVCLNKDCYVSLKVRQEIEDTMFLPRAEIEKRKSKS